MLHIGDGIKEEKDLYEHKPFVCETCGNTVIAIGLWGYCEKCESNYLMLETDRDSSKFVQPYYLDNHAIMKEYFIEVDNFITNDNWPYHTRFEYIGERKNCE